jgi:hypothetical protein
MLQGIAQMTRTPGDLLSSMTALEQKASTLDVMSMNEVELSNALAELRKSMNATEALVRQYSPDIELSGANAAVRSTTSRLFYGTAQDMIAAGIDPTSAEAYAYFMQIVKERGIPYVAPDPSELVTNYTTSQAFMDKMDKWGDGYGDYVNDAVQNGLNEGWSPIKTARYLSKED